MLGMLVVVGGVFSPYFLHELPRTTIGVGALAGGLIWSTILHTRVLAADVVVRKADARGVMPYLVVLLLAWVGAMGAGSVLHDMKTETHQR